MKLLAALTAAATLALSLPAQADNALPTMPAVELKPTPGCILALVDGQPQYLPVTALSPTYVSDVELHIYRGDDMRTESAMELAAGFSGTLANVGEKMIPAAVQGKFIPVERVYTLVLFEDPGSRTAGGKPSGTLALDDLAERARLQPAIDTGELFHFAGLDFTICAPGADRFEATVTRRTIPAYVLDQSATGLPIATKAPETTAVVGKFSGTLNQPEREIIVAPAPPQPGKGS